MCQESLINYLDGALNKDTELVPREDIEIFIHLGEQISHYESVDAIYGIKMPKSIERHARLIDEKLINITVCDLAVGSGAFPVGMMTEIVRARRALTPYFNDVHERTAYHFKRHAIQNCLYGVDIDPSAVEIAKLRLWLSLVVDEEETNQIKPLPNLDYKIMQGNSLIEEYEGIKLFDEGLIKAAPIELIEQIKHIKNKISSLQKLYIDLHSAGKLSKAKKAELAEQMKQQQSLLKQIQKGKDNDPENADLFDALSAAKKNWEELKKKHQEFFSSSDKSQKDELRKRIANLELELIKATLEEQGKKSSIAKIEEHIRANTRPFFLWELNFGEIFLSDVNQDSGFDIVIANPPYIGQKGNKLIFDKLKDDNGFEKKMDLWYFFLHKAYQICKEDGINTFITPNYWITAQGEKKLEIE
jgi:methylase of polypeptide subunit release factors